MPKILEDRRKAIARNNPNLSESSTWAIATSALQKEGKMPKAKRYQAGGKVPGTDVPGTPDDPYLLRYRLDQQEVARERSKRNAATAADINELSEKAKRYTPSANYCAGGKVISTRRM